MQEVFAIGAAFFEEAVLCHDYGADHAGAQVALLAWRDEVFAHGESEWRDEGASLV